MLQADPKICWVCGARTREAGRTARVNLFECGGCAHLEAKHPAVSAASDYHLGYEQGRFVESLGATRRRQATRILAALETKSTPASLLDFGCGRGWLLEEARARGIRKLAGADVSGLALGLLRNQDISGIELDRERPFEELRFDALGFTPEVICFLDVLEHFAGNLTRRLRPWLERLPIGVRRVVIKVPVRDGLLFHVASSLRRAGMHGPIEQLFQCGTDPPHYQYFSRRSLESFVASLGLSTVDVLDDLDFEPKLLAGRIASMPKVLEGMSSGLANLLGATATKLNRTDTRIVIAARP